MRLQAGVKSIAMGGRPKVGPIQGIGGVKGAQSYGFTSIYGYFQKKSRWSERLLITALVTRNLRFLKLQPSKSRS